jgi:hypothetical protein
MRERLPTLHTPKGRAPEKPDAQTHTPELIMVIGIIKWGGSVKRNG